MIASSRLIPLDMTNVTWLTTCYKYDALGRQIATWQTNYAALAGLPVTRTRYDQLGRVIARVDTLGNTTTTEYSSDGRTVFVRNPNTSTRVTTRSASGDVRSITGTAVTPEFHTYGILPDGTRWSRTVQGETASSPRFTKRYENLLDQTIREERSGFHGAVLSTTHAYDSLGRPISTSADYEPTVEHTYDLFGNRVATTRMVGRGDLTAPPSPDTQWRKSEALSNIAIIDGDIWLTQTNIVSCSDTTIAPLFTSSARQLTGLTAALPSRSRSTDIRGNVAVHEALVDSALATSRQTLPYATNKPLALSRYGVSLMDVSVSAVTNTVAYDSLGRQIANTDGRGNTRHIEYNSFGLRSASIDALGNRTVYAYNQFGNLGSVTDPLGNATVYECDLRGRKTYEGGATYPVRYTYDIFGNKIAMVTYRDEKSSNGDETRWLYDEASNYMTNKVYADGKGTSYSYDSYGRVCKRIWARGIETTYSYNDWGELVRTDYSDDTTSVVLSYDAMGRQVSAIDAAGVTTFAYDIFGALTNETVVGVADTNTIERFYDAFGRDVGYALNGVRQSTLAYDPTTGHIASMLAAGSDTPFTWNYLEGSDLKSSLAYPNGLTASWQYDANNQLLQVCNASPTNTISQYDYSYDAAGRRVQIARSGSAMSETRTDVYGYNIRNELVLAGKLVGGDDLGAPQTATAEYAYEYDDIGNRITSFGLGTNRTYIANNLNQYSLISNLCDTASLREEFHPQFDDDGNQTLVKTATGIWSVTYNGENRPILWSNGTTNIFMSYDCMGRRVAKNGQRFVYNGYLQIADNNGNVYVWDPTEPVATRPLVWLNGAFAAYYTHGENKCVSEVVAADCGLVAYYEYSPFCALIVQRGTAQLSNPWRFSSEYFEDDLSMVYYNYRHYDLMIGRWLVRDSMEAESENNCYAYISNRCVGWDVLGERYGNPVVGPNMTPFDPASPYEPGGPYDGRGPRALPVILHEGCDCEDEILKAIELAQEWIKKSKCSKWFQEHDEQNDLLGTFTVVCHGKSKVPCWFFPAWTTPFNRRIGVCANQLENNQKEEIANVIIHEIAHHYCTILWGREDCAMSAQDACMGE